MPNNHLAEIEMLDKKTSQLLDAINKAEHGNSEALKEFLRHIRNPGWTTPAELAFTNCFIDSLTAQYNNINVQVNNFVKATKMVSIK
jgi:hypothetical protein